MDNPNKKCPNCHVEYNNKITNCADCGELLVEYFAEKCDICKNDLHENEQKICYVCRKSTRWIRRMRKFAWIAAITIFIIGVILGHKNSIEYGCFCSFFDYSLFFIYAIISFIIALASLFLIMIFLDMAEDIKAIRNNTQDKDI